MKKLMILFMAFAGIFVSCAENVSQSESSVPEISMQNESHFSPDSTADYIPLNFTNQAGLWLPYMDFEDYMYNRTEDEYREEVRKILSSAKAEGINTVYFHIHPNGDAYYKSEIFPKGIYYTGDYDPLEIMLDEAHDMGISVHGWINPYRMQTAEQMTALPDDFIVNQWVNEDSPMVKIINGRYYLNPAYDEVTELVSDCADEILRNYDVDGIHIDDYFYPTTDTDFDREAFESSGNSDLAQWRTDNITEMVKSLYDTVKSHNKRVKFGISPQGNISANYNSQYADVKLWADTEGYADYIIPQIYFGFKNETCPFEATLHEWEDITGDGVSLVIGLAEYKTGEEDKWAGASGETEWIENPDIIQQQIDLVKSSSADGYALYR
ncbi:MAG: family 10 glycosylhydrolase [Ruminococcus flavefaciens]|nr:family 10 glycosylhydrolase [Ruminococcus flavefaciens]MCM1229358.1 family 10 glycosylhydrolase [Ruminococcus flavefaciens]